MPEAVKPVWVDGYYETEAECASDMQGITLVVGLEGVPTPALTLEQIEEWLRREYELSQTNGERGYVLGSALLAQVQAWKTMGSK